MGDPKKVKMGNKWYVEGPNGYEETEAPVTTEDLQKAIPVTPAPTNAVKVQRFIRDQVVKLPNLTYPLPLHLVDAIRKTVTGDTDDMLPGMTTNLGTGEARNTLTNFGARGGMGAGLALTKNPGGGTAGYGIGGTAGSLAGQGLEYLLPNLFKSGYEGGDVPEPNIPDAVADVALSGALDLGAAGARKGYQLIKDPATQAKLLEKLMISKYATVDGKGVPRTNLIDAPLTREEVNAINANKSIPQTVRQVLGEDNIFSKIQSFLTPDESRTATRKATDAIAKSKDKFLADVSGGGITPITAENAGKAGLANTQGKEIALRKAESAAYNDITKGAGTIKVPTGPVPVDPVITENARRKALGLPELPPTAMPPRATEDILGPIKLTHSRSVAEVEGKALDAMISDISDPALAAELKLVRQRMSYAEGKEILPWETVREMETQLGRITSNPNLAPSLKNKLNDIRSNLVGDIQRNLEGKVKETADAWPSDSIFKYNRAKRHTVKRNDLYPDEITSAVKAAAGEVPNRPGERGGEFAKIFQNLFKSRQDAERISKTAGEGPTKTEFVRQFLEKHSNNETKTIAGKEALTDLESDTMKEISNQLLSKKERQNLRYLLLLSKNANPNFSKAGKMAFEMMKDGAALSTTSDVANAVTGGGLRGVIKNGVRFATMKIGGESLSKNFLLNDQFARRLANLQGKAVNRPGIDLEIKSIINSIQGAKVLIEAGGKKFIYDTDTKKVEEQK
jgi:hypothetical protein